MNYESLIGKKIRIIELDDPYEKYRGREGVVQYVGKDPWDDVYLSGTWGGINIYPKIDKFEVIEK